MEKIRAFIAFHLPDDVREKIGEVQEGFRAEGFRMRMVRPENIHLTLKFFGDIEKAQTEPIAGIMAETVADTAPLMLSTGGLGVFPTIRKARVLWLGLKGDTHALIRLQQHLDGNLERLGFAKEKRPFKAHLTIARIKESPDPRKFPEAMEKFAPAASLPFSADEMILWQSRLRPSGPIYSKLKNILLKTDR